MWVKSDDHDKSDSIMEKAIGVNFSKEYLGHAILKKSVKEWCKKLI